MVRALRSPRAVPATTQCACPTGVQSRCALTSIPSGSAARRSPIALTRGPPPRSPSARSEEHTSELQSQSNLVCRLLLEKKKNTMTSQLVLLYRLGGAPHLSAISPIDGSRRGILLPPAPGAAAPAPRDPD